MPTHDQNQPVTVGIMKEVLGEFTEDVILPAVRDLVKEEVQSVREEVQSVRKELGSFRIDIRDHIDRKLSDLRGDLISVMKGEHDRDRSFKVKILDIIKRNKLAPDDEIDLLGELAR